MRRRDSVALASNDSTAKAESPSQQPGFDGIIGSSHLLLGVFDLITRVAPSAHPF